MQAEGRIVRGRRSLVLAAILAVAVVGAVLDLATKYVAFTQLGSPPRQLAVCGFLNLVCSGNKGGVFGVWQGQGTLFIILSIVAISVISWLTLASNVGILGGVALGLVLGGAVGNLYDRVAQGQVRDFIDFHIGSWHWYLFNVADALICVGVALLVLDMMIGGKAEMTVASGETERPR